LATFDVLTGKWSTLTSRDGLPHDRVVSVVRDGDHIWVACRTGLAVVRRGMQKVETIDAPVFPRGGAFMIGLMADGRYVWANHFEGVARLDKQTQQWTALSNVTPLLPRHVIGMAHAGRSAWFLSPGDEHVQLVRFDYESGQFEDWKVPEEVKLDEASSVAATEDELFVGTNNNDGIYVLDPQRGC